MRTSQFVLPETLADYPWPRHLNPHYNDVAPESSRWTESFRAFDAKAQKSFNRCDFGSLPSILNRLLQYLTRSPGKLALLAFPLHDKGMSVCPQQQQQV